jgi:predicted transcriptional regulator
MDPDPIARITGILRANPKGIGITRIAQKAGIHRSTAIKYLELLRASG